MMIFPIKKRIKTELFIERTAALNKVNGWLKGGQQLVLFVIDPQIKYMPYAKGAKSCRRMRNRHQLVSN